MKIRVAVGGSKPSLDAVNLVIDHADWYRETPVVERVTVHRPVPKVGVNKAQVDKYYQEEGREQLAAARKKLDAGGIKYAAHILIGSTATKVLQISDIPVLLVK